jgi:tetratricopeptide (TPR) repeat protein
VVLGPEQQRTRLLEALTRAVLTLGQIAPHLLILEDLHWADEATWEALTHLAPHLAAGRVLAIGSYRNDEARARPAVWEVLQALDRAGCSERLELAPLTAEETSELVRCGLGLTQGAQQFAMRLYRETGGNPLFVLETLRDLYDEGVLYRDRTGKWSTPWDETTADYAELPLPAGVRQVIARRLARLGPNERMLLNAAAVLGADFDFTLLVQTSDLERRVCLATASGLVQRWLLLEEPAAYRFSHDQVRRVAYSEMPEAERRHLHRRAGEALEARQPQPVGALAYHFAQAQVRDKALAYGLQAGEQAQALYAYAEALACYERALDLAGESDLVARWELHRRREAVLDVFGRREEQMASLAEMLRLAVALGDEGRRGATLYRQGRLKASTGAPRQGLALLQEASTLAQARGDLSLVGECQVMIGRAYWHLGDKLRCLAAAEEAQTLFRQANDRRGEVGTLNLMGNLHLGVLGHYERALRCFEQVLAIARELGDAEREHVARLNAGIALMSLGCYRQSQDHLFHAGAFFAQMGHRVPLAVIAFAQGHNSLGLGDCQAAQHLGEQGLSLCRETGDHNFEIENLMVLGLAALYCEQHQQARTYFEQAIEAARAGEQSGDLPWLQSYLALTCLHLGEDEQAQALSTAAVAMLEASGPDIPFPEVVCRHRYQILARLEGGDAARPWLERAWRALMERADAIESPELRRSFLENVRENREIVAAYRAWQAGERPVRARLPRAEAPTGRSLREDE